MQPSRLSFSLDHLHVTENWNEPLLLAGSILEPAGRSKGSCWTDESGRDVGACRASPQSRTQKLDTGTTFLQGELAKTPRASHSDDAVTDQGARLIVRNTNALETVPDETEDDARTLYCEWDEHGERFKNLRKSVLESKTYDWNHGRFGGAPTCLHTCKAMEKLWEQSKAVAGTFSERQTHQW